MKVRVTALLALAAVVAMPAIASAATMGDADRSIRRHPRFPIRTSSFRATATTAAILFQHRTRLPRQCLPDGAEASGQLFGVLDRFCREYRG